MKYNKILGLNLDFSKKVFKIIKEREFNNEKGS